MIRPVFSTDPMQPNQTRLTPVYSSGPMQPRPDVQSFDLTRNFGPSRSLVTGDRSLTRNPNGRMGMPQLDAMGERIGSRGMTPLRRMEIAARRGDMRANETLLRAQVGMGGFGPQGFGPLPVMRGAMPMNGNMPPPPPTRANNNQPLPPALDPLANLPPPATTEEALGMPSAGAPAAASGQAAPVPMLPPLNMPWQGQPLPGGMPMGQLPPSTLMGGAGLPPPPAYSMQQVGGFNVLTGPDGQGGSKFLNAYTDPNRGAPTPMSAAELGRIRAAGYAPAEVGGRSFDAQGVPYLQPLPQATEKITEGPTGTTRTYTQPRGTQAAPPASNYFDSLLPAAPTASTQTGQMPAVQTASTQTGQMPNVAYAAPINPAQLLDEARNEYARTGNDTALKQYFAQYPSEAVQINQAEQQIWKQIGSEVDNFGRAANEKANNYEVRNDTLNMGFLGGNPFTTGTKALEYDAAFPGRTKIMNAPLPQLDAWKFLNAKTLSDNAAIERAKTMERIRYMAK